MNLADQLGFKRTRPGTIDDLGKDLDPDLLKNFRDEQIVQLYELLKASKGFEEDEKPT